MTFPYGLFVVDVILGELYGILRRQVVTNQRIFFDVFDSRWVAAGATDGVVRLWDLTKAPTESSGSGSGRGSDPVIEPIWSTSQFHPDCVNGVSFHPTEPVLVWI